MATIIIQAIIGNLYIFIYKKFHVSLQGKSVKKLLLLILFCILATPVVCQEKTETADPTFTLATNVSCLNVVGSIVQSSLTGSIFINAPIEAQFGIAPWLAFRTALDVQHVSGTYGWTLLYGQCGLVLYPEGKGLQGWNVGISPGLGCSLDSGSWALDISAEVGYQWVFPSGFLIGIGGGAKFLGLPRILPDLVVRLGWAH